MRTDPELALSGRYVVSKRLQPAGFEFEFPDLEHALRDLLKIPRCGGWRLTFGLAL
jgi:NAD dependent epimerase/dehydratase family enzyme